MVVPALNIPATGVIVTGGAAGIGLACAEALAEVGRPVAIWDINEDAAIQAAEDIAARFQVITLGVGVDVTKLESYGCLIDQARQILGNIGGLLHAAGVSHSVPIEDLEEKDWDIVLDVNLKAYVMLVRALLPDLRANTGSSVVGIASINALLGNQINPAYSASKGGLLAVSRALADGAAKDNVRVNAICPGYIRTAMMQPVIDNAPERARRFEEQSMMDRFGEPYEIGNVARFLLSNEASFITGQHIVVDGGVTVSQR
jgi:NAD(P)-dependent dehydrogenase (short-subunit alcohol dehydrogenase family)